MTTNLGIGKQASIYWIGIWRISGDLDKEQVLQNGRDRTHAGEGYEWMEVKKWRCCQAIYFEDLLQSIIFMFTINLRHWKKETEVLNRILQ